MYVDWEYYKIFYYVAKYQNFTKAARSEPSCHAKRGPSDCREEPFSHLA